MDEMADYQIEQNIINDYLEPRSERSPLWTDAKGKQYWRWKNIEDLHLLNIINLLERRRSKYLNKFLLEAKRRCLVQITF